MCVNYVPIQRKLLRDIFGVEPPELHWPPETWPNYQAPIIRLDDEGDRAVTLANFGFLPKGKGPPGVRLDTVNAKSETVGERKTFSLFWKMANLCLIPMESFFEPNYEADPKKSTRYRIWVKDEPAFAVAGLWRDWPDGMVSFTMLTVNADGHPLMSRMHAPGKEKRSIVIVRREGWDDWLRCRDTEVARSFLGLYRAERMETAPAPITPRAKGTRIPQAALADEPSRKSETIE